MKGSYQMSRINRRQFLQGVAATTALTALSTGIEAAAEAKKSIVN